MAERQRNVLSDQPVEEIIGNLLRAGVIIAASVVLIGGIVYLARHGEAAPDHRVFFGEPAYLRGVSGIITDALTFSGRGIIQLGLLLLVATPVARVVFSVAAFALQGDRTYVVITLIVLAVLGYSLLGGACELGQRALSPGLPKIPLCAAMY